MQPLTHEDAVDVSGFAIRFNVGFTEARRLLKAAQREGLARSVVIGGVSKFVFADDVVISRQTDGTRPTQWKIMRR